MLGFFRDSGNISMMRLMSFIALVAAVVFAGYGLYTNKDLSQLATLCGVFLMSGFGGKAIQSFNEKDKDNDKA